MQELRFPEHPATVDPCVQEHLQVEPMTLHPTKLPIEIYPPPQACDTLTPETTIIQPPERDVTNPYWVDTEQQIPLGETEGLIEFDCFTLDDRLGVDVKEVVGVMDAVTDSDDVIDDVDAGVMDSDGVMV